MYEETDKDDFSHGGWRVIIFVPLFALVFVGLAIFTDADWYFYILALFASCAVGVIVAKVVGDRVEEKK